MRMVEVLLFVSGAMLGSVANAIIDRLPRNESWCEGRSKCDVCRHTLNFWDLIPIVSYLSLGGKCRYCHSPIPFRNLMVEIFLGVGFVTIGHISHMGPISQITIMAIAWVSTIVFVMDQERMLVSDAVVLIWGMVVVLGLGIEMSSVWGMLVGVVVIGGIWFVSRGRAMGSGDIGIIGVIGLWLGYPKVFVALWMAFVIGAIVSTWLLVFLKKSVKSQIAFGPYLITGGWIAHFWGDMIVKWIFH